MAQNQLHPILQYAIAEINLALFLESYRIEEEVLESAVLLTARDKATDKAEFHIHVQFCNTVANIPKDTSTKISSYTAKPVYLAYVVEADFELWASPELLEKIPKFCSFSLSRLVRKPL